MTFPYLDKPDDWQTAYTREQAYRDSEKYGSRYTVPFVLCFLLPLAYAYFRLSGFLFKTFFPLIETYSPPIRATLVFIIILVSLALFMMIVNAPAMHFASSFFTEFYRPPKGVEPAKIINYRLSGKTKLPPPLNLLAQFEYIIAKDGGIDKKDKWPAWSACNLGGPILLIVFDGNALYLERGNRFSRVVGPGEKVPFLEWYETIKYVVDLRPKIKTDKFDVWTKDGIKINLEAQIECRIGDSSKNDPANGLVYPYDPAAVKKAIERYALRWPNRQEEPNEFTWVDAVWGQVTGIVPGYIGSRTLDDLLIADRKSGQILSPDALKDVKHKLDEATQKFGVFVTDFQILKVDMPEEVYKHQKEQWTTERQSIDTITDGQTKAFHIRSREKARADAQRDLILSIVDGLEKNKNGQYAEPLLLSLSGILDNSLKDPLMRAYTANETLETLEKIKSILEEPPS